MGKYYVLLFVKKKQCFSQQWYDARLLFMQTNSSEQFVSKNRVGVMRLNDDDAQIHIGFKTGFVDQGNIL